MGRGCRLRLQADVRNCPMRPTSYSRTSSGSELLRAFLYGAQGNKCGGAHLQVRLEQLQQLFEQALLRTQRGSRQMNWQRVGRLTASRPAVHCGQYSVQGIPDIQPLPGSACSLSITDVTQRSLPGTAQRQPATPQRRSRRPAPSCDPAGRIRQMRHSTSVQSMSAADFTRQAEKASRNTLNAVLQSGPLCPCAPPARYGAHPVAGWAACAPATAPPAAWARNRAADHVQCRGQRARRHITCFPLRPWAECNRHSAQQLAPIQPSPPAAAGPGAGPLGLLPPCEHWAVPGGGRQAAAAAGCRRPCRAPHPATPSAAAALQPPRPLHGRCEGQRCRHSKFAVKHKRNE